MIQRILKLIAVGVVLFMELAYFTLRNPYPHGAVVDISYRQHERLGAHHDFTFHPSPETKARWDIELRRMHRYQMVTFCLELTVLIVVNGFVLYYFNNGCERTASA